MFSSFDILRWLRLRTFCLVVPVSQVDVQEVIGRREGTTNYRYADTPLSKYLNYLCTIFRCVNNSLDSCSAAAVAARS